MDEEAYEHSAISQAAYDYHYKGVEKAQQELEKQYPDYVIDPEHSNQAGITVVRPDGTATVGFRGTNPYNAFDWTADLLVATGYPTIGYSNMIPGTRFDHAEKLYNKAKDTYDVTSVTGHSLGGSITDYIARRHDIKGISFNPGETPLEYFGAHTPSKTKVFTTGNDPVSMSAFVRGNYDTVVTVPMKDKKYSFTGSHSLNNFLRDDIPKNENIQPVSYKEPTIRQVTYPHSVPEREEVKVQMFGRPCRVVSFRLLRLANGQLIQKEVCDQTMD